ncbi:722_t:CDS:2 [Paraglomus brasilianum]|uniref:722_t:CDS:1 n=1 Tax=Paraglomus brasilianum TaxID=144538 RepID=A0A9N9GWA7_9GLOM|nr:722_t:CDS:2 [Paraglomus brasilianum]
MSQQKQTKTEQGFYNTVFGSIAGMVGKLVEYPFDTVKVRLQAQPLDKPTFDGPLDCFKKTIKREGLEGLYRGLSSPMVGAMLENAMLFVTYKHIQSLIRENMTIANESQFSYHVDDLPPLPLAQHCIAGAISGALASLVLTPVELIKCKLQVHETFTYEPANATIAPKNVTHIGNQKVISAKSAALPEYSGPLSVIKYTLKEHGIKGFYTGHLGTLLRETFGGAVWFGAYEYTSGYFLIQKQQASKDSLSTGELMFAGAMGGMSYNLLTFPVDSIKSRMQTEEESMKAAGKVFDKQGSIQIARQMYKADGIKAFYKGCGMTVARSAPSSALIFLTYVSASLVIDSRFSLIHRPTIVK